MEPNINKLIVTKISNFFNNNKSELFINDDFIIYIKDLIKNYFPKLNEIDLIFINHIILYIINFISIKFNFDKNNNNYINQWKQNNNRDIIGSLSLILPYIDNDDKKLNNLTDLNHILYNKSTNNISIDILKQSRNESLLNFKYSNLAIGLLKKSDSNSLLDLYDIHNNKLIYKIIINNFIGLLQTLNILNGKLYLNWINIVPFNLNNYNKSNIYLKTKEKIKTITLIINTNNTTISNIIDNRRKLNIELNNKIEDIYNGLWLGDIYNILRNRYYEKFTNIKWLIYPYEYNNNKIYLIQGLNKLIDLTPFLNKTKFNKNFQINNLISNLKNNISLFNNINIDYNILKYLLINLINSNILETDKFINFYKHNISDNYYKFYNKFYFKNEYDINEYDDYLDNNKEKQKFNKKIENITNTDIIKILELIINYKLLENLWMYLIAILDQFIKSSYGKFLIEKVNDKLLINNSFYYYKPFNNELRQNYDDTIKINLKNIYNISKSLSRDNNWNLNRNNYISLSALEKNKFFYNINSNIDSNISTWLKLKGNFQKQFGIESNNINYDIYIINLLKNFKFIYLHLIFEELISSGVLSYFTPNIEITDNYENKKNNIDTINKIKKIFSDNMINWDESYYYLTNEKFKDLPKKKDKNNFFSKNCFENLSKNNIIMSFPLDWMSQINFFHHYIYHQIIYVTGATGIGKSTQVPKLLLYALKAIDYNYDGKVVCTVPRKDVLTNNSFRIADELGIPINNNIDKKDNKYDKDNYYVQYDSKEISYILDKHYDDYNNDKNYINQEYYLKIITDGTLKNIITNNPLLTNSNNSTINLYDIVIIDEAHEHNLNMDLLILLMRQTCYYNNTIRLVIMSATMDEDESIYRRYFNTNNDNLIFPIKNLLDNFLIDYSNIVYNIDPVLLTFHENYLPSAIYMDRRYHISPPNKPTRFNVKEIYLDNNNNFINDNSKSEDYIDKKNSEIAQQLGINKIIDLCKTTSNGNILFFCTGKMEIIESVNELNKKIPPNVIALAFYSDLSLEYKTKITNIKDYIDTLNIKKIELDNNNTPDSENIIDKSLPNKYYNRVIIVATNAVEASVTIDGLKYIIDTGYAKVNIYNYELGIEKLIVKKISENSRKQRRGRIGRTDDGEIYYMYMKNFLINIKPYYQISISNFDIYFKNLLCFDELEKNINISYLKNYENLIQFDKTDFNLIQFDKRDFENQLNNLNINDKHKIFGFIWNNHYKINRYELNENITILNNYYINHYYNNDELEVYYRFDNRYNNKQTNGQLDINLLDQKGQFFLIHYFENNITRNILNNIIKVDNIETNYIPINHDKYKKLLSTLYYNNLIIDNTGEYLYNICNNINILSNLHKKDNNKIQKIIKSELSINLDNSEDSEISEINNLNKELTLYYSTKMKCKDEINNIFYILEIINYKLDNLIDKNKFIKLKKLYNNNNNLFYQSDILYIYLIILKIIKNINYILYDKINKLISNYINYININNNVTLKIIIEKDINYRLSEIKKEIEIIIINIINKNKNEIIIWSNNNNFNSEIVVKFITQYYKIHFNNIHLVKNKINKINKIDEIDKLSIEERILKSFMYGYFYNNKKISNNQLIEYTFLNIKNSNNSYIYLKNDINNDNKELLLILTPIDINIQRNIGYLYYNLKNNNLDKEEIIKINNLSNKYYFYLNNNEYPLIKYYYNLIIKKLNI